MKFINRLSHEDLAATICELRILTCPRTLKTDEKDAADRSEATRIAKEFGYKYGCDLLDDLTSYARKILAR